MRQEVHRGDGGLCRAGNVDPTEHAQIEVADVPGQALDFREAEVVGNAPEPHLLALRGRGLKGRAEGLGLGAEEDAQMLVVADVAQMGLQRVGQA